VRPVAEIGFEALADGTVKLAGSVGLAKLEETPVLDG
jgi:hypothetical protein